MQKHQQKLPFLTTLIQSEDKALLKLDFQRPAFSNPICKATFNSLPRIYGKKKKKSKLLSSSKQSPDGEDQNKTKTRNYFSSIEGMNNKAKRIVSQHNTSIHLSEPRNSWHCNKKNCSCHGGNSDEICQRRTSRLSQTKTKKSIFPQVRRFDLEEVQSEHKVSVLGLTSKTRFGMTGLQQIIQQNSRINSQHNSPKINSSLHDKNIQDFNLLHNISHNKNVDKKKHQQKTSFHNSKFEIQQEQEEQNQDNNEKSNFNNKIKKGSARYKTQPNYSSPKSSNSISLSSLIFQGAEKNTKFHDLNKSQVSLGKSLTRKPSQLSNGLFRIPEEDEFRQYLKGYKNVAPQFNIRSLIKSPKFRIVKTQKGVYFGEFDEIEGKNGQGINVSEKQIFQGRFHKNLKFEGYERNIDGVFFGKYKNGFRYGFGIFKWNNGEIFEGNWENGMKCGYGVWKSPKGDYYEGEWLHNRQHGQGLFKHKTSTYKGQFKNFLKDGKGSQRFSNGDLYQGQYKEGKPNGKGRYQWSNGGYYEGEFQKGMRQGKGHLTNQDGTIYEGSFKQDFKHGYGRQTYSSGEKYEGEFFNGVRTKGKLVDKNHNIIDVQGK